MNLGPNELIVIVVVIAALYGLIRFAVKHGVKSAQTQQHDRPRGQSDDVV